eukprot:TRINITY_DN7434_c0_g1_i1.p1 TRINITY_DN7434_c0_g1~~TRINITY_DN7434_c0_g1_i1.p1  ORF type:complete len:301 (-),score=42.38 TRINITY_DN7434_c0_g1_i1:83-985(-)
MLGDPKASEFSRRRRYVAKSVAFVVALPWVVFFLISCLFLFVYHDLGPFVWVLVIVCGCLALMFLGMGISSRQKVFTMIGFLSLSSVVASTCLGLYVSAAFLEYYYQLEGNPVDVDPLGSKPLADVSAFKFANRSFVDGLRTVGYVVDGSIYCVAPVSKEAAWDASVRFWAVGRNCCEKRSNFLCDGRSGKSSKSGSAFSLAVEVPANRHFQDAVEEAKAIYGMSLTGEPRFVESVSDVQSFRDGIWDDALTLTLAASTLDLVCCTIVGVFLGRSLLRALSREASPTLINAKPPSPPALS